MYIKKRIELCNIIVWWNIKKIINLLDDTPNQPSKFRAKGWVEISDEGVEKITPIVESNLKLQY